MQRVLKLSAAVGLTCAMATSARAEIIFCNDFPHTVFIAIAYPQDTGIWISRGWFEVASGQCGPFDTALRTRSFYYRAESEPYRSGGKQVKMSWGDKSDRSFAIWEDANFQYYDAEHRVLKSTLVGFAKGLDGSDERTVTVTFGENGSAIETLSGDKSNAGAGQTDSDAVAE
jgi:hypothetical protein